jgi:hypothetical protein
MDSIFPFRRARKERLMAAAAAASVSYIEFGLHDASISMDNQRILEEATLEISEGMIRDLSLNSPITSHGPDHTAQRYFIRY